MATWRLQTLSRMCVKVNAYSLFVGVYKLLKLTSKSMWACLTERKVKILFYQTIHFSAYNEESIQYNGYMHSHHCCSSSNSQKKNQPGSPAADSTWWRCGTQAQCCPLSNEKNWNEIYKQMSVSGNIIILRHVTQAHKFLLNGFYLLTSFLLRSKHYRVRVQLTVFRLTPNLQAFQNLSFE